MAYDTKLFKQQHKIAERRFNDYLTSPNRRHHWRREAFVQELRFPASKYLFANNFAARCLFAEAAVQHLKEHLIRTEPNHDTFFVTVAVRKFALSESESIDFNVSQLQAWFRHFLANFNFFAMVEAGLYVNWSINLSDKNRCISWHVHAIVWGSTYKRLRRKLQRIDQTCESVVPGLKTTDCRIIKPHQVASKLLYSLKAPQKEYMVYPKRKRAFNPSTGKIITRKTGRYCQKKRDIRPGNRVVLCRALADRHLDRLAFAGGEGRGLLLAIRDSALRPLKRFHASRRQ
jgi:hypothetical protein